MQGLKDAATELSGDATSRRSGQRRRANCTEPEGSHVRAEPEPSEQEKLEARVAELEHSPHKSIAILLIVELLGQRRYGPKARDAETDELRDLC